MDEISGIIVGAVIGAFMGLIILYLYSINEKVSDIKGMNEKLSDINVISEKLSDINGINEKLSDIKRELAEIKRLFESNH